MKLPPVTVALVLTALILGGFVYVSERRGSSEPEAATETTRQKLFSFEESQIRAFTVKTQLRSLRFEKDGSGDWRMLEPEAAPAEAAAVAYLLNLVATASSDRLLTVGAGDRQSFGFHQPLATIEVTLDNQQKHTLVLGGYDFNRGSIYAQADPPNSASELQVALVSPEFENAVSRPLEEWKAGGADAAAEDGTAGEAAPPAEESAP